jgi:hypothetical protein
MQRHREELLLCKLFANESRKGAMHSYFMCSLNKSAKEFSSLLRCVEVSEELAASMFWSKLK